MAVSLHLQVVDALGAEIVHGQRPPGDTFTTSQIEDRFGVSRSVAREAIRVLEHLGLLRSSKRIGSTVQDVSQWSVLAPEIIAWRMRGPDQSRQLRALTELRYGIEPAAARLAARRATWQQVQTMAAAASEMSDLGTQSRGNSSEFLSADVTFHRTLLEATGNPAFTALAGTLAACLETRNEAGLTPAIPLAENLTRHVQLAEAIGARDEKAAEALSRAMVLTVDDEVS